jgi:hypothetical protein
MRTHQTSWSERWLRGKIVAGVEHTEIKLNSGEKIRAVQRVYFTDGTYVFFAPNPAAEDIAGRPAVEMGYHRMRSTRSIKRGVPQQ